MKKTNIIFLIIFLTFLLFVPRPPYVELNHLIIVDTIQVECIENQYKITLKEIIPIKDDNGIEYEYKKYFKVGQNLDKIKKQFEEDSSKKIYYKKTKYLKTNCIKTEKIRKTFEIKPIIIHKRNKK